MRTRVRERALLTRDSLFILICDSRPASVICDLDIAYTYSDQAAFPLASSRLPEESFASRLVKNTPAKRGTAAAIAREAADVKGDIRSWRRLRVRLCSGDRAAARSTIIVSNLPLYRQFTANLHPYSSRARAARFRCL